MLRGFVGSHQETWADYLVHAEHAYNSTVQSSTGSTPVRLLMGADPGTAADLLDIEPDTPVESVNDFVTRMKNACQIAAENLALAQDYQSAYANQHRRPLQFNEGDWALLSAEGIATHTGPSRKLAPRWLGPFRVHKVISPLVYELALPATVKYHPVFHISKLKPYRAADDNIVQVLPEPATEEPTYEVQDIVGYRKQGRRKQYLVLWKGYPLHEATWDNVEDLSQCTDLIQAYHARTEGGRV